MMKKFTPLLLAGALIAGEANADTIKIATWNIEWLHEKNNKGSVKRDNSDYRVLAGYADELDADIVVLQEIDGAEAAKRVLDSDEYTFYFSSRRHTQKVGIAFKDSVREVSRRELKAFDIEGEGDLRFGVEMTFEHDGELFTVLALHLKSSCFSADLSTSRKDACVKLASQLEVLEDWVNTQARSGIPFIIAGDLNRRLHSEDGFWLEINDGYPNQAVLTSPAMSYESECNGGQYPVYIDHIIMDKLATRAYVEESFSQVIYRDDHRFDYKLSDHCPISVELSL